MTLSRRAVHALVAASLLGISSAPAMAQDKFPTKPVRIVVPFAAGGPGDILARLVATQLTDVLGQSTIVDNRPGANGELGTVHAAKSPADGYTVLQVSTVQTISMALQEKLGYHLLRDFEPVAYVFEAPLVLVTPGTSPDRTLRALVDHAKAKPDGLSYGIGGVGTVGHLAAELFKRGAGIAAVHVPYKGNGAAMGDLIGGRLDFYFSTIAESVGHVESRRLNALPVTSARRDPLLPEVPTMAELGFPNINPIVSWSFVVPKGTPAPVVKQLGDALTKAVAAPSVQERLRTLGVTLNLRGPDVLATTIQRDYATWSQVIKAANIRPE